MFQDMKIQTLDKRVKGWNNLFCSFYLIHLTVIKNHNKITCFHQCFKVSQQQKL